MANTINSGLANEYKDLKSNTAIANAAFTVFDSDILSYVVYLSQDRFKPNKDEGVTFYYGVVTNIIDNDTTNYDKRDIFRSKIDGVERINNTTTKTNSERQIYIVHIPSLYSILFNDENFETKKENVLRPEDLYKFRIENTADLKQPIAIGNIVKIKFEKSASFENGIIEQVVEDKLLQLKIPPNQSQEATKKFENYKNCVEEPINKVKGQSRVLFTNVITTKDVASLGLYDFLESFIKSFSIDAESKLLSQGENASYILSVSKDTYEQINKYRSENNVFNEVKLSEVAGQKYFLQSDTNIKEKTKIQIKLATGLTIFSINNLIFYYQNLFKNVYSLKTEKIANSITVTFDIEDVKEDQFYDYSKGRYEAIKEFGISPLTVKLDQEAIDNLSGKNLPTETKKCEDAVTTDLYIDISTDKWKRQGDKSLVDFFFKNTPKISSNDKTILESFSSRNILNSHEAVNLQTYKKTSIIKANSKFYSDKTNQAEINKESGGSTTIENIEKNLKEIRNDLSVLKKYIQANEGGLSDQNVLILPLKWFEPKPSGKIPKYMDDNSQFWYGRAVQFVVYIKQNGKIFQIPSEIVYLYVKKIFKTKSLGLGLFISGRQYLQYERLEGTTIPDKYWTSEPAEDELEKLLSQVSENDFDGQVKQYVLTSGKYKSFLGSVPQKIRDLTI